MKKLLISYNQFMSVAIPAKYFKKIRLAIGDIILKSLENNEKSVCKYDWTMSKRKNIKKVKYAHFKRKSDNDIKEEILQLFFEGNNFKKDITSISFKIVDDWKETEEEAEEYVNN